MYICSYMYILSTILKDLRLILELHLNNMLFVHEVFIKLSTKNVTIDTTKRFKCAELSAKQKLNDKDNTINCSSLKPMN